MGWRSTPPIAQIADYQQVTLAPLFPIAAYCIGALPFAFLSFSFVIKQSTNKLFIHFIYHNKQKTMKKQYNEPQIYVENVVVENGIAVSPTWGDYGHAGQDGEVGYYEDEL